MKLLQRIVLCLLLVLCVQSVAAQQTDSIATEDAVDYLSSDNGEKVIAALRISGAETYEDYVIRGFSGLSVGQKITIPGTDITNCVKRFWKQGYFSDVQILADKMTADSVWLHIALKQLPRISSINYYGVKTGERDDISKAITAKVGKQLTPDLLDRTELKVSEYFADKGFHNAQIKVLQKADANLPGNVLMEIKVKRGLKVKVRSIHVSGNKALSLNQIDKAMKKTNRQGEWRNLFRSKKFVKTLYKEDKQKLLDKYNEIGYRDARLLTDSVVKVDPNHVDIYLSVEEGKCYYFGEIKWLGNTIYPSAYLNDVLNIRKGEIYNKKTLDKRLFQDQDAVSSLYKNKGYLFMQLDPIEAEFDGDTINYEMRIYEGKPARINKVTINGNTRVYEHVIRREMRTKPGQLYSQADLVRTLRELAQLKLFDEEKLYQGVDIQPDYDNGTVDLAYNLETKSSDQVQFSAGYGNSGVVLSVGLKFSNFAVQNLFRPSMYHIVPQGEGQTLSINAQTNGLYYQNYSISLVEPWLGGKRPNSLSVSMFYSIQTGYSQRFYDNMRNYASYGGYGGYGGGYGSSYGNNGYQNYGAQEYDSDVYIHTFGARVGYGTRLKWPDDYFTFYADLGYQRYSLQDWYKYVYGFETGIANNIVLTTVFSRNSIDNPIYTRRGSNFSISAASTLPYSLFDGNDYENMADDDPERYKFIEYYKFKLSAKTFTPLSKDDKLVLMTRAEYGFLGYYNKFKRSPFERFYVGGDGMSGYRTAGTETVGLRGYTTGSLTPRSPNGNYNGNLYTRLTMELRYPVLLSQSSTIWATAFIEGGNCWAEFEDFDPFMLKRSAGVGIRVFLPMFGLLGVDWGYGFDTDISGQKGGSQFSFILGQEF